MSKFRCQDRKSTRLNSSHRCISYAVFFSPSRPFLSTLFPYTTLFRSLFSHLEHFEPPVDFVDRVMTEVSRLPLPQFMSNSIADGNESVVRQLQHTPPAS